LSLGGTAVRRPFRVVTRTPAGGRRVFLAAHVRMADGWVEAMGAFVGDGRDPMHVSIPMWTVEYIEESGEPMVRRGWVRPRLMETPCPSGPHEDPS
jgi:hypothetical protein